MVVTFEVSKLERSILENEVFAKAYVISVTFEVSKSVRTISLAGNSSNIDLMVLLLPVELSPAVFQVERLSVPVNEGQS